jgi:surface antigen Omp85-like protein
VRFCLASLALSSAAVTLACPAPGWAQSAPATPSSAPDATSTAASGAPGSVPAEQASAPAASEQAPALSRAAAGSSPARGPDDRRALPDYDGRPERTTLGDVALWVPRVVLFPLYVVSEYVVRRPLGWLATTAERERWPTLILNFFTFGDRQGGIIPTGLIDTGMRASIGVYAFWNDFAVAGNDLRLRATYGGAGYFQLRMADRFPLGGGSFAATFAYDTRRDNVFRGIGRNLDVARSRYGSTSSRGDLSYRLPWVRSSYARLIAELRETELDGDPRCCDDQPSVNDEVRLAAFGTPPGMDQVYDVAGQSAELVLDSRWPRFPEGLELGSDYVAPPGTGVRVALRGGAFEVLGQSLATDQALADAWVRYGITVGGSYDLTGEQRSVSAAVIVDFVEPIGAGDVPMTDLVSLGGERPLRGFLPNQFLDRSAAALRLEYRWPVAVWLDGSLLYEAGNVFGEGLAGFDVAQFRSSYGIGLTAVGAQDHPFQALIAIGTKPYEDGARVDSFRFVFGTTAGF